MPGSEEVGELSRGGDLCPGVGMIWANPSPTRQCSHDPLRDRHRCREVRFTYGLEGPHQRRLARADGRDVIPALSGGHYDHHLGYLSHTGCRRDRPPPDNEGFKMELLRLGDDGQIGRATFHHNPLSPGI